MRLTQTLRQAFVNAVMQDVPMTDYVELIRARALEVVRPLADPRVLELWDDPKTRGLVAYRAVHPGGVHVAIPPLTEEAERALGKSSYRGEEISDDVLRKLCLERQVQDEAQASLRRKLQGVVDGCNTGKQLREALPEFAKYLPEPSLVTKNLPALANVVADFAAAGWPKGKEPVAA